MWRSPHGQVTIVDTDGTHDYGRTTFANRLWHAANTSPDTKTSTDTKASTRTSDELTQRRKPAA